jgi:hypothetical protein
MTCLLNETWNGEGVIEEDGMAVNVRGAEHYSTDHAWAFFSVVLLPRISPVTKINADY